MASSSPPPYLQHTIYEADWSTWTRRIATVLLILGFIFALTLLGPVLQLSIFALILAFALFYPVRALTLRLRFSYPASVGTVFLIYFIIVGFVAFNLSGSLIDFGTSLAGDVQVRLNYYITYLRDYVPGSNTFIIVNPFTGDALSDIDFILIPLSEFVRGQAPGQVFDPSSALSSILPGLFGTASTAIGTASTAIGTVTGFLGNAVLVHLLALLFMLEIPNVFRMLFGNPQSVYRRELGILAEKSAAVWVGFFRGQLIVCLIIGVLTALQLTVMGIENAIIIGVITAVASLIPLLGGFIALVPLFLVPLLQGSTTLTMSNGSLAVLVVLINLVMQQVIWNVVSPKITGDAVNLPVPAIILGLFIGVALGGVLGALLAAPVMGIVRVLVIYIVRKIRGGDPYPGIPEPGFLRGGLFGEILVQQAEAEKAARAAAPTA
jgi:predicted PurR-regulated permease PerM